jgi:hypothetical protein
MSVRFKEPPQDRFPVWENVVLIQASSEEEAFSKAERCGRDDEGDHSGSFRWDDRPAVWVFAGIRKLIKCVDPTERPGDGTEVTYTEMELESAEAVDRLAKGESVAVRLEDE